MPKLEDRNICHQRTCLTCKHLISIELDYTEPPYDDDFCLLDLSDDDRKFIRDELDNSDMWSRRRGEDFSAKFLQLMKWIKPEELPPNSERIISVTDVCQFYKCRWSAE